MIELKLSHLAAHARDVVVIGVGNTLRGDDAFGHAVVLALKPHLARTQIYIVTVHQLLPELALTLRHAKLAVVVDAAVNLPPGRMITRVVSPSLGRRTVGHCDAISDLLEITRRVSGHAPETWMVTIGGSHWEVGAPLSPVVDAAIPRALHEVELIIAARCPACPQHPAHRPGQGPSRR